MHIDSLMIFVHEALTPANPPFKERKVEQTVVKGPLQVFLGRDEIF